MRAAFGDEKPLAAIAIVALIVLSFAVHILFSPWVLLVGIVWGGSTQVELEQMRVRAAGEDVEPSRLNRLGEHVRDVLAADEDIAILESSCGSRTRRRNSRD